MFGSHLSISGGMHNAIIEAQRLSFDTVQVFTKNQQQWRVPPLDPIAVETWKKHLAESKFEQTVSHDSYLINLASPDPELRAKSIALFDEELKRCDALGIGFLVTHPGAHLGTRDDESCENGGCERVAEALDEVLSKKHRGGTTICLESTAGQGTGLGAKLEHLQFIINEVSSKHRKHLAVCLDTAHLFAAGYDFRGKKYNDLLKSIEKTIGLDCVKVWHLNDSKKPLGSRVDRHAHIGHGEIGIEGFRPIMKDKRWKQTPKILETPKDKHEDGREWDTVNLETLTGLMK
ncbi:MAG TPA: deoxyribonuclease IV [Tepidisphaeraceae bacterium]|nr:deoxyribonuclease IV [Tepidisphaeraceae bacterium]